MKLHLRPSRTRPVQTFLRALLFSALSFSTLPAAEPVFNTPASWPAGNNAANRTWYARGSWWAWLPAGDTGSRVWKRTGAGQWEAQSYLDKALRGLPGHADVWCENFLVVAVLTDGSTLALTALAPESASGGYRRIINPLRWDGEGKVSDARVSMDMNNTFWVLWSADGPDGRRVLAKAIRGSLSAPGQTVTLGSGLTDSDACSLVRLNAGVISTWTESGRLLASRHSSKAPDTTWYGPDVVTEGSGFTGGPLSLRVPPVMLNGLRLTATYTSGNSAAGLVLMRRELEWSLVDLTGLSGHGVFAPAVVWQDKKPLLIYASTGAGGSNALWSVPLKDGTLEISGQSSLLLGPVDGLSGPCLPKSTPPETPLLVLASDSGGNVYEVFLAH